MTFAFKTKKIMLGMALLCTVMGSAGVTLGRLQDGATLGRPLDVRIQVTLDDNEASPPCMAADVSYGETRLSATKVTVSMESPSTVRVVSPVLVDEPIVSVSVRVGCLQQSFRQYTLLTDLPGAPVAALSTTPVTPSPVTKPTVVPSKPVVPMVQPSAPVAQASAATSKVRPRSTAPRKTKAGPRLQLEALDLTLEQDPVLKVSSELLTLPQEDLAKRAEAEAWWRALNASPETLLQEAARLQSVQADIQSLQTISVNNQKSLDKLTATVLRAEAEKYANPFVYSLAALCVASLFGLGFLWWRLRQVRAPSWSHQAQAQPYQDAGDSVMAEPEPNSESVQPEVKTPQDPGASPLLMTEVDLDLNLLVPNTPTAQHRRDFSISIYPSARSMDTEELLDIRQQADFFLSLGQHEKAIVLLSTRISQCGESSPLICLDLLQIYHNLGRQSDFEFLRAEFNHWFTGHVPEFAHFLNDGLGLDNYPQVINRIVSIWPEPSVLEYIENCLYHHSGEQQGGDFDLHAYRDLLLLHSVAKRIVRLAAGNDDEHHSEFMRIPAAPSSTDTGEDATMTDSRAAAHRAGAHLRGTWLPAKAHSAEDPEVDIETRSSPLGAMRVPEPPVVEAPKAEPLKLELVPVADTSKATDFNFLSLR
jgi:hypothetical protein